MLCINEGSSLWKSFETDLYNFKENKNAYFKIKFQLYNGNETEKIRNEILEQTQVDNEYAEFF